MNLYHVAKLATIVAHLTGYTLPDQMPIVHEISSDQMAQLACHQTTLKDSLRDKEPLIELIGGCPVIGLYKGGDDVYVDAESSNSPDAEQDEDAVVVHELVHWLQRQSGHRDMDWQCPAHAEMEREAYHIQTIYIQQYEHLEGEGVTYRGGDC